MRRLVPIPGVGDVGIFNVNGEFFGVKNVCPHQGGPMCLGKLTGTTRPRFEAGKRPEMEWIRAGEILRCPWHGWEFDIRTGKAIFSDRTRIATYDVHVGEASGAEPIGYVLPDAETYLVTVEEETLILEIPDRSSLAESVPGA